MKSQLPKRFIDTDERREERSSNSDASPWTRTAVPHWQAAVGIA